ncbi:hypothetical protein VSDG_09607 [Cytospora chrysosperma]|uniref:NmrA-like domain-containing protein n=1 Tax=Cytospora chrysosperma TaxID=252740 RepID=A0A423V9Q8_CYTCH|nr:hypothetical protein VSDG_09607 [Valsa sordida]
MALGALSFQPLRIAYALFVCSATGYQGGALVRQLRKLDWEVHATTRDLNSNAALCLRNIGVQLTEGDWDDTQALEASIAGCDKLYLCLMPNWDIPTQEPRQCQTILDIAKAAGVKQVISSTTLGVSMLDDGVAVSTGSFMQRHMVNKKSIEKMVEDAGFDFYTLLRPTFFMANFLEPKIKRYAEIRDQRSWTTSMTPGTDFTLVDHEDIAKFAATAFQHPKEYHRRALGLASDQLKVQEMLDMIAEAAGQPGTIRARFLTDEEVDAQANSSGFSNSHKALRVTSNYVDLKELGEIVPLTSFRDFLEREKEAVVKTFSLTTN